MIDTYLPYIIVVLLVVNILTVLIKCGHGSKDDKQEDIGKLLDELEAGLSRKNADGIAEIRRDIDSRLSYDADENRKSRTELSDMLSKNQDKLEAVLRTSLIDMQELNKVKLEDIRTDINKKLDTSLNERLDSSFKNVGEQLNKLYVSLGELSKLENGVSSLNKTLSNVKTRGIFGEMQLENILADILPGTLYDKNVVTKKSKSANRDAVEFAVRIPDKEISGAYMYLPIDSKFPASYYDRIADAAAASDAEALRKAVKELEQRVKNDAKDIRDKYIDPPNTTDFGIMFLPTESLYAEVLRIGGLVESCQQTYHVIITGPSTLAALLNSLSIGFRYMAVNRDSKKVLELLRAIKSQYAKLSELIGKASDKIEKARKATDDLQQRADLINRRLASIEAMDADDADALLGNTVRISLDDENEETGEADEKLHGESFDDDELQSGNIDGEEAAGSISPDVVKPQSRGITEDFLN